ncbi:DNA replication/repair protein RecF [Gilvimarinus polysaccharolyticus]|uniref:DNA replication/repair protein RecF n=1 Tax=Gilvimarinus polysaccharolyticus TaxID=863921 RepID=UPI0006734793|nr:DNA replication/repair protein RecF [Gilvimarinus polysaccharolyticus]
MSISRLSIQNLRNVITLDIQPSSDVNLIFGENGSGKTSILESIHVLSLGRSFRGPKIKALINEHCEDMTVFARLIADADSIPLGVTRSRNGDAVFKARGQAVGSLAELAGLLPLQVINADVFLLLEGSPATRRQFLDWLVFHVEPTFFSAWKAAQRCLKQRNSILRRDRIEGSELAVWERELVSVSERIVDMRTRAFNVFSEVFHQLIGEFVMVEGLTLSLYRGWEKDKLYADVLADTLERDSRLGFTGAGVHRSDIRIRIKGHAAADVLSRGQQKLLVCAMKITQGVVFAQLTGRHCIFLVDDLPAELDEAHRQLLVDWLDRLETQVFITGVEQEQLLQPWREKPNRQIKLFHVEQGKISEQL